MVLAHAVLASVGSCSHSALRSDARGIAVGEREHRFVRSPGIALALLLLAAASARAAQTPQSTPAPHPSNTSHLAQVDHCPLHVVSFMLVARGESGTLDRYVVA